MSIKTRKYVALGLHLACQNLRESKSKTVRLFKESLDVACQADITGFPRWHEPPCQLEMQVAMASLHFLSPDGKCQVFDHKANGYLWKRVLLS